MKSDRTFVFSWEKVCFFSTCCVSSNPEICRRLCSLQYFQEIELQWNPFIGTTVGTEGSGPIRGVVLLKGWSKMAPRTRWDNNEFDNTEFRGNLYIHDSSIHYSLG